MAELYKSSYLDNRSVPGLALQFRPAKKATTEVVPVKTKTTIRHVAIHEAAPGDGFTSLVVSWARQVSFLRSRG